MNKKVVKGARNELSLVKANVEAHVESSGDCVTLGVAQCSANKLMNLLIFIELNEAAQVATSICLAITNVVDNTRVFEDKQWAVLIDALVGLDASLENCVDTPDSFPQSLESPRRAMAALATHEAENDQQVPDGSVLEIENSAHGLVDEQENELAGIDPEILEIFNEEATEELEVIQAQYALWKEDPSNGEAIDTVRRSFHTLKGSGNVVGAITLG
ncbi:MAG: Hpt domain-containing protein, partial [Pseudomonadales bacterium]|nr:Hpt domain-containing protein [Pseudomonadales bacterium]